MDPFAKLTRLFCFRQTTRDGELTEMFLYRNKFLILPIKFFSAHSVKAVYNFMRFIENLTFSQFVAFEELVKDFVDSDDIDQNMIQVMFEIHTKKLENVTNNESRLALQLLVICSK